MGYLNFTSIEVQNIISICTLIISCCAICLTVYQIKQQQKFNINSVRPICDICISDFEDDISVIIKNVGAGTMHILKFYCKNDYQNSESILDLVPNDIIYWSEFMEQINDRYLAANDCFTILRVVKISDQKKKRLRRALSKITIYVEYTDVYNTQYETKRTLDYFARTLKDF